MINDDLPYASFDVDRSYCDQLAEIRTFETPEAREYWTRWLYEQIVFDMFFDDERAVEAYRAGNVIVLPPSRWNDDVVGRLLQNRRAAAKIRELFPGVRMTKKNRYSVFLKMNHTPYFRCNNEGWAVFLDSTSRQRAY